MATAEKPAPGAETVLREQTQVVSNCTESLLGEYVRWGSSGLPGGGGAVPQGWPLELSGRICRITEGMLAKGITCAKRGGLKVRREFTEKPE